MSRIDKSNLLDHAHLSIRKDPQHAASSINETKQPEKTSPPVQSLVPSDQVDISLEAKAKGAEESSEVQNREAMQDLATMGQKAEEAEEKSEVELIEKMIEELEEKVRELTQQLAQLKAKDDEASMAQQKALEEQIAALNAQIMALVGMKLEMLEQGKK